MSDGAGTTRRSVMKRGLLAVGALLGGVFVARGGTRDTTSQPPRTAKRVLKLFGEDWHISSASRKRGQQPARGESLMAYGELVDGPDGDKIGEFYSTGVHVQAPFGPGPYAAANVEMHTFNLRDGTIIGMGSSRDDGEDDENTYAVLAGTGLYAGISGTYTALQDPEEGGGDGIAEFEFDLTA